MLVQFNIGLEREHDVHFRMIPHVQQRVGVVCMGVPKTKLNVTFCLHMSS